jgi:hypothetical protein
MKNINFQDLDGKCHLFRVTDKDAKLFEKLYKVD